MVSSKSNNEGEKLILGLVMEECIDDYGQRHRQPGGRQGLPPLLLLCLVLPTGGSPDQLLSNLTVDLGQRVELPCLPHNQVFKNTCSIKKYHGHGNLEALTTERAKWIFELQNSFFICLKKQRTKQIEELSNLKNYQKGAIEVQ